MTKHIEGGGPAFPLQIANRDQHEGSQYGMTLRDYFAGQALAAMITATSAGQHNTLNGKPVGTSIYDAMAMDAYALADAMLRARQGDAS